MKHAPGGHERDGDPERSKPRGSAGQGARSTTPHLGLPRSRRIRKRPDFLRIQDSPARVGTRHLLILLAARAPTAEAQSPPRLGVVASRKVGNAVARNRCKRLVREAFRLHQATLPRAIDLVIIVRPGTHTLTLADVEAEITHAGPQIARRARDLTRSG